MPALRHATFRSPVDDLRATVGELGDGLNIFQGIYLVGIGWNEGSVGTALSLMGLTALIVQTWAGDLVDKTTIDRRLFLTGASLVTALSASTIFFVREGNQDHGLIFVSKIVDFKWRFIRTDPSANRTMRLKNFIEPSSASPAKSHLSLAGVSAYQL